MVSQIKLQITRFPILTHQMPATHSAHTCLLLEIQGEASDLISLGMIVLAHGEAKRQAQSEEHQSESSEYSQAEQAWLM